MIGNHQKVKCNDCHKGTYKNKPLFAKCTDCHTDYHKGDFTSNSVVKDCKNLSFRIWILHQSNFTIEDHNKTKFIIDGSHLAVACRQCHYKRSDSGNSEMLDLSVRIVIRMFTVMK